jgi:hypothetical protein
MFYFLFAHPVAGVELWKSNGTVAGTKSESSETDDNDLPNLSWVYTKAGLYFRPTTGSTAMSFGKVMAPNRHRVGDQLNANAGEGSEISLYQIPVNGRYIFTATDGDNEFMYDLFALDGDLVPLPVKLDGISVSLAVPTGN